MKPTRRTWPCRSHRENRYIFATFEGCVSRVIFCALVCFLSTVSLAQSPRVVSRPPQEIIQQLWMDATAGALFTDYGIHQASGFFLHPEDAARNKPLHVISNYWAVWPQRVKDDTAEVEIGYEPLGNIDAKLRFKPAPEDGPCVTKYIMVYHLALLPTYSTMYVSDGKKLTAAQKRPTGEAAWQITDPRNFRWTTVNTAIRFVLEKRGKPTDPVIRENADRTIKVLLHYQ
jgi:hypothetical protein